MLTISRMKSVFSSQALSLLSPPILSKFKPFPTHFCPHSLLLSTSPPLRINPNFLFLERSLSFPEPLLPRRFYASRAEGSQSSSSSSGEIHVIIGPMFAGKTTTLLRRIQSKRSNGRTVAIIKSIKDTRYGLDSIVTHDGDKYPCLALADLSSFRAQIGSGAYNEEFGSVLDVIPLADSVTKLTARCELCGKQAHFTLRKNEARQTELIAGAEVYMPACRQHHVSGQAVIEAARMVLQDEVQCG